MVFIDDVRFLDSFEGIVNRLMAPPPYVERMPTILPA